MLLLEDARILDPERPAGPTPGKLLVSGERIEARLEPGQTAPTGAQVVSLAGAQLAPGLLDLHFHGELVFCEPEAMLTALQRASASLVAHGVTAFLATTVAWRRAELPSRIEGLARALETHAWPGAVPIGLHLEGPWIRPEAAGAQPPDGIRDYDPAEGRAVLDRADGAVRMVTFAPELPGASWLQAELGRRGILMAIGHTLCDARVIDASIGEGARHATHLFNAMGPLHQRGPGVAGAVLGEDRLSCDLIADGAHVHPAWVRAAARAKREALILISDRIDLPADSLATPAAAAAAFGTSFGSGALRDAGDAWRLPDGRLAGSRLGLDRALRNVQLWNAMSAPEAVAACTLRPARLLGMEAERGTLRPGARADFVVLGEAGEVLETWIGGRRAHRRSKTRGTPGSPRTVRERSSPG